MLIVLDRQARLPWPVLRRQRAEVDARLPHPQLRLQDGGRSSTSQHDYRLNHNAEPYGFARVPQAPAVIGFARHLHVIVRFPYASVVWYTVINTLHYCD
jgi:hypothetical protein